MGVLIIRVQADSGPEFPNGFLQPPLLNQAGAEIVVRHGRVGLKLQCGLILLLGILCSAFTGEHIGQFFMGQRIVGVDFQTGLILLNRFVETSQFFINNPKVEMGTGQAGFSVKAARYTRAASSGRPRRL